MDMETLGYFIYMDDCERRQQQEDDSEANEDEEEEQPLHCFASLPAPQNNPTTIF